MRQDNSEFKTSFLSEAGSFVQNKDYFAYTELEDLACWVVVKGLDTDQEINSAELAVKGILEKFVEKPSMSRKSIKRYLKNAQEILREQSLRVRLKASVIVVVSDYSKMIYAVAGNSRLYHFRNGRVIHKSADQSLAQKLAIEKGYPIEIDDHEERNNLLNYLGKPNQFQPFVSKKIKMMDGDVLLLCTAGLWEEVHQVEMTDALVEASEPEQHLDLLEEMLLSKQKKIINNYTMASIFVNKVYVEDKKKKMKYVKIFVAAFLALLLAGGGTVFYKVKAAQKVAEITAEMFDHQETGDVYFGDGNYPNALKEYSEGRNAAKKIKNPIHRSLLAKKLRMTQLIIDGDEEVKEGNLSEAIDKYEKAKEEAKLLKDFGIAAIEQKIKNIDEVVKIIESVKDGDFRFEAEDYNGALKIYKQARKKAIAISYSGENDIKIKIEEAEEKIDQLKRQQRELRAASFEKDGDRNYDMQAYAKAVESYTLAQEIYQETELLANVLSVERKIMNAKEKLNPVPLPEDSNTPPTTPPNEVPLTDQPIIETQTSDNSE